LRARVGATVSLWTSGVLGSDAAGLTVSSWLVVTGEPGRLVAAVDPDSDLYERFEQTGRAVVQLLTWPDRQLAEAFAGVAPAPGGPFRAASFVATPAGPRLAGATTWAEVAWESSVAVGWSMLVTATVSQLEVGDGRWLVHRQGRYQRPDGAPDGAPDGGR
jgi:flavin reductase (DIM6/NTAB) family NADH-FMN oxidoreductase RutF